MNTLDNVFLYASMIDIDGTLKDLVSENNEALLNTLRIMGDIDSKCRGKFILYINRINMYFVKTGLLPTNEIMQKILILFYSFIAFKKYKEFKKIYFEEYNKQNIFFEDSETMLKNIKEHQLRLYLVTKNTQNSNILSIELYNKNNLIIREYLKISKVIIAQNKGAKYYMYKQFMKDKDFKSDDVIIIGDNLWDDILPAILLKTKVIWCNMYKSKFKKILISIFKKFFNNIKDERDLFITR